MHVIALQLSRISRRYFPRRRCRRGFLLSSQGPTPLTRFRVIFRLPFSRIYLGVCSFLFCNVNLQFLFLGI